MEGCKGCRDAGDEEAQGQHYHGYPYHPCKDKPATVQACRAVPFRALSHRCWRMLNVHSRTPCLSPRFLLLLVLPALLICQAPSFVTRSKKCVFIRSHLTTATVLKSLRKPLRTGRLQQLSEERIPNPVHHS